ncbi:metal ABC transporter solute-binding protein, Zn/Mn family [Alicyclobacillus kakegawensis]|uniref:metal ABC transporter solute-binding protein, Zn/Mn family n=1 Tax=Alicyclobacillus kakegawensis TaxID=392012 RepID=UPI0009FA54CF|nr:zinc ABC transporter substrate-binding protein [Alicyclobacillus kakegawensis]
MQKCRLVTAVWIAATTAIVCACGSPSVSGHSTTNQVDSKAATKVIHAIGAENEYADVIKQIGGRYVSVEAIMSNPNTDPHTYEAGTHDAAAVSQATLVVQNGLGYDGFMNKLEAGSPNPNRKVIDVSEALGLSTNTRNPHLWYKPGTMTKVAQLVFHALSAQDPKHKSYFEANLKKFQDSLETWHQEVADLKREFPHAGVAVTEPVADYLLQAAGLDIKTPWAYEAAVMNDTDPAPQLVEQEDDLLQQRRVKVLVYNQQVVDPATKSLLALAKQNHIPVVGVYETMPAHHNYQSWMEAEIMALKRALQNGKSTERID